MSNELHTMPLMLEKLFSSRKVNMLKLDEFGAYIRLLGLSWLEGGKLPNDLEEIRRCLTIDSEDQWERIEKFVVKRFFYESPEGKLTNSTLVETYQKVLNKIEDASGRGRIGANARWGKAQAVLRECQRNAGAMQTHGLGNGNQTQTQTQSQTQSQREEGDKSASAPPPRLINFNPTQEEPSPADVVEQAVNIGIIYSLDDAKDFIENYKAKGWTLPSGVITNWTCRLRSYKSNGERFKQDKPQEFASYAEAHPERVKTKETPRTVQDPITEDERKKLLAKIKKGKI